MNHVRVLKTFDLYESRKHNTIDMIDLWIILMFSSKTDNTHTHTHTHIISRKKNYHLQKTLKYRGAKINYSSQRWTNIPHQAL